MRTDNFLQSPTKTEPCYHALRIIATVYIVENYGRKNYFRKEEILLKVYGAGHLVCIICFVSFRF